jgi:DNA-binding LacI/PurR family transcriptional regulator
MDDDEYARRTEVPLTTMRQPFEEIGARATHILIDHLRGSPSGIERVFLSTQLVIRQSCGGALLHQNQTTAES